MSAPTKELARLYETMARMRAAELIHNELWRRGRISGEMHSAIGEEGIVAGVLAGLEPQDAIACDHRPTPVFVGRGVPVKKLLLECMGSADGLGGGCGGHMHLLSREHLLSADGIVGSSGPQACGFALAALRLRPGSLAVAFFGEGAINQGMMMEAFNLAVAWRLPVLFVCKDNGWSIMTRSARVTAGRPAERAAAFGLRTASCSGRDVLDVAQAATRLLQAARQRREPGFLHARCRRPYGHFLGDPLRRFFDDPRHQVRELGPPLWQAAARKGGAALGAKAAAMAGIGARLASFGLDRLRPHHADPVARARKLLRESDAAEVDARVEAEFGPLSEQLLAPAGGEP